SSLHHISLHSFPTRRSSDLLSQVTPHVSGPDTVQIMSSLAEIEKQKITIQKAYLLSCVNSRIEDLAAAADVLQGKSVAPGVQLRSEEHTSELQSQSNLVCRL